MKNRITNPSGFTLIEIMIVVAIIGMLAAIAVPNFAKARTEAQRTGCVSNLQRIDGAIQVWALEQKKDADQPVSYADIGGYLKNAVVCPSGGTSFADSYTITTVDAKPACQRRPDRHKLPL